MTERRRNVRSSIADLRVLYANQMQTLHTQIEGSSKYVPTTPGRHVVAEMDGILALNAATYKVDHTVRFVVLDDAVLVARIRRRRNNAESDKLVAERCWPLNEMLVLDTKDTASKRHSLVCAIQAPDLRYQRCRTCSRSDMARRRLCTAQRHLRTRNICSRNSVRSPRNFLLRDERSAR